MQEKKWQEIIRQRKFPLPLHINHLSDGLSSPNPKCLVVSKEKCDFQVKFHGNVVDLPPTVISSWDRQSYCVSAISLVSVERVAPALFQCKLDVLSMQTVFVEALTQPRNY